MATYLGLDIGGSGVKAAIFSADGDLVRLARREYAPSEPEPGQAEIDIRIVYNACRDCVRDAAGAAGRDVKAMAVSSQGQTFVPLDGDDEPLYPAIMWYDPRAAGIARNLSRRGNADSARSFSAIATAPKIIWLHEQHPARMSGARRYLLLPDYIAYRLTGKAVTDPCTAESTGLYRSGAAGYDPTALARTGIDVSRLSEIRPTGIPVGVLHPQAAEAWGLTPDTCLVVGTNDQYAGAIGAGNVEPGVISLAMGTALALVTLTGKSPDPVPRGLLAGAFPVAGMRALLSFSRTTGLLLDRFRRKAGDGLTFDELESEATRVTPGFGDRIVLPAFDGAGTSVKDTDLHAMVDGLLKTAPSRGHAYRQLLESVAFSVRGHLETLAEAGCGGGKVRAIGGGARSDLLLQTTADVCHRQIERPSVTEGAVLGAAMIAMAGSGLYRSVADCSRALYRTGLAFRESDVISG